jgi:hypothetical protein
MNNAWCTKKKLLYFWTDKLTCYDERAATIF